MSIEIDISLPRDGFCLNVTTSLPSTGITALYGASGSGKTSLLRTLAGLEKSAQGTIRVNGAVWQNDSQHLATHRRSVGYVFQEPSLFEHLSVKQNLEYGTQFQRQKKPRLALTELIDLLGLQPLLHRSTHNLSGGEKQRLAIGRALAGNPALLLMDEPLAALDRASKDEIMGYLETLQRNLSLPILYVSHTSEEVARLAETIVLLDQGQVIAQGPLAETLSDIKQPFAQQNDAFSVLHATIIRHQQKYALTELDIGNEELRLPGAAPPASSPSQPVRLRVFARDISLCLNQPSGTSILNILPARITAITDLPGHHQSLVQLALNSQTLVARISSYSRHHLELTEGMAVFAQIKAVALMS